MPTRAWPRLMAIVDADVAARAGWSMPALADACVAGGARLLQLRAKAMASGELLDVVRAVVQASGPDVRVIVNDRADIARLAGAAGVHVGQEDLAPLDARRIVGPTAIVGLSTHTPEQLAVAVAAADAPDMALDYAAIGPVFATGTKNTGYAALGLEPVRRAAATIAARGLPLAAIGGVTLDNAADVVRAGAAMVAVISDLVAAGDPAQRVREYLERLAL